MTKIGYMFAALIVAAACSPLAAQATLNFTGSIDDVHTRVHKIQLDYGSAAQPLTLNLQVSTTSADGVEVDLIDLTSQLALFPNTAEVSLSTSGTDSEVLVTPARSGIHEFFLTIDAYWFGTSAYNIALSVNGVVQSQLVGSGPQDVSHNSGVLSTVHSRAFAYYGDYFSGGKDVVRFKVNFGAVAQAVSAAFEFDPGFDITGLRVYEEGAGGDTLLYSASGLIFGGLVSLDTTPRSGEVIFRVEADINSNGSVLEWSVLFPATTTPIGRVGGPSAIAIDSGTSSSGSGGGCVAGDRTGGAVWIVLLMLASGAVVVRRRRA